MSEPTQFYYNLDTKQVEEGQQSPANQLMGPYASREAAQHALEKAASRNEDWDRDDAEWDGKA